MMLFLAVTLLAQRLLAPVLATAGPLTASFWELPISTKPTFIEIANGDGCVLHVEWKAELVPSGNPPTDVVSVSMTQANPICDKNAATFDGVEYDRWPLVPSGDIAAGYLQVLYGGIAPSATAVHAQGDICGMVNIQLDGWEGLWSTNMLTNLTAKAADPKQDGLLTDSNWQCVRFSSQLPDYSYKVAGDLAKLPNPYLASNLKLKGKGIPIDTGAHTVSYVPIKTTSWGPAPTRRA